MKNHCLSIAILLALSTGSGYTQAPQGLDPLTADEIEQAKSILLQHPDIGASCLFPSLSLHAPSKEKVLAGSTTDRQVSFVARYRDVTYQGVIDITADSVLRLDQTDEQHAFMLSHEWRITQVAVKSDSNWQQAMQRRGISDFEEVICVPNTVGYFGDSGYDNRRLVRVSSYLKDGVSNYWSRPIEGVTALLDLEARKVIRVLDTEIVPVPSGRNIAVAMTDTLTPAFNPVRLTQDGDPNYQIDNHWVEWYKWRFHFSLDPRAGLVIAQVTFRDGDRRRQILYTGSLSELFVPYMDPTEHWYSKTYLDAGEYGMGKLAVPMVAGKHCPQSAVLIDAVLADDWGDPSTLPNVIAIFERYSGDPAWLHYESIDAANAARRNTELVVRSIAAVGNYDYIFDWIFKMDGSIKVTVGASGIEQVKGIQSPSADAGRDSGETKFGHMIAPHTLAINHDHFFCYRLDLDVDGRNNSLVIDRLRTQPVDGTTPRKSIWDVEPLVAQTERAGRLRINLERPALWRIINPDVRGPLGYPVSYHLKPAGNAVSLLSSDDYPQIRAGFTDYHLWVTPYAREELYAAGEFPNQNAGGGLPVWTMADRNIKNTDIVVWYNVGFHHVVRAEDWPVLPVSWHSFLLRPFDFFEQNPALNLRD